MAMLIGDYYFHEGELPTSVDDFARTGLPKPHQDAADEYEFDPSDASIVMYFQGRPDIPDGAVNLSPSVEEGSRKVTWECWTSHYPHITFRLPNCTYYDAR